MSRGTPDGQLRPQSRRRSSEQAARWGVEAAAARGRRGAEEEGIGRILALSDGVFAIALTLLVVAITVPAPTGNAGLPKALLDLWPRYLAYLLSFVVIARFWVVRTTRQAGSLPATTWHSSGSTFFLLMFMAFLPFPTAVLGQHKQPD